MSKFVICEDAYEVEIRCITDDGTEYCGLVTIEAEFDEWEKNGTSTFPQMQCMGINQVSVEDGNIMFALAMNHLKNIGMDRVKFMGNGKSEYFFVKLHPYITTVEVYDIGQYEKAIDEILKKVRELEYRKYNPETGRFEKADYSISK